MSTNEPPEISTPAPANPHPPEEPCPLPAQAEGSSAGADDSREPMLANFRVLARTNVILRGGEAPNCGPNAP
jgi:hypothetical protein